MGRVIKYNNLGQLTTGRLVYFRSTDVEQHNYHRLMWSVPDEWFYLLSKKIKIVVTDISSNHTGKIERIFLPTLVDVLNYYLLNREPANKKLKAHFKLAIGAVEKDSALKRKIVFWKGKIKKIDILGRTIIKKEPNPLGQDRGD